MMAIWNMEGASHDLWAVNTDFEYHEEQRLVPEIARMCVSEADIRLFTPAIERTVACLEPGTEGLYRQLADKAEREYVIPGTTRTRVAGWINRAPSGAITTSPSTSTLPRQWASRSMVPAQRGRPS